MKKTMCFLLCVLLLCSVLMVGCDAKPSVGGGQSGGGDVGYQEALEAGNYAAAYAALLAGDEEADQADADKFLVVPTTVVVDNPKSFDGSFTAGFTYNDKGLLTKVDLPKKQNGGAITYTYDAAGRVITQTNTEGMEYTQTYTYDDQGRLTKDHAEYESGRFVTLEYVYNEDGLIDVETRSENPGYTSDSETEITTHTYSYDANGNEISRMRKEGYGEGKTYDEKGNLTSKYELYDGEKSNIYTYTYDDQNRLIKEHYTDSLVDPHFDIEHIYAYDSNGTRYTVTYTDDGDSEKYTYAQTFDEAGRLTSYTYTERDDNEQRVSTYDTAGNIVQIKSVKDGAEYFTYTYAYNEFGYRTQEKFESEESNYEYTVTYDVLYFEDGAPELSAYIGEMLEEDSFRYAF